MKVQLFSILIIAFASTGMAQRTAIDFTASDCNDSMHHLFSKLDSGKVIVLVWVMPCGTCVGPALTTYNVVESYQSAHPNTVYMYLCDDVANTNCASLNSWANENGITKAIRFSDASIDMRDYGSVGMPKIVVLGSNYTVWYNVNNTVDATALQNAINKALTPTGISEPISNISSLNATPNPAGNSAEIKFNLAKPSDMRIELFNPEGKMLATIFSGNLTAGENIMSLDVATYGAGTYLVKLSEGDRSDFIKLVVAR